MTERPYVPATGEPLPARPDTPDEEVRRAVARARHAQQAWGAVPVDERAERLMRLRDALYDQTDDLVELLVQECGKPRHEALLHEVAGVLDAIGWCAEHAPRILAPERLTLHLMKHRKSEVHLVPRGVVGVISPYNLPLVIPMVSAVEALVAGNACVIKPSELTPRIALKAKEIYDSTGLPEDLLAIVPGSGATGRALVEAGIDYCVFTGTGDSGRRVAAECGARLVPCTMELGGKAPLIACDDCDLERTAQAVVFGGFANSGQTCIRVERVYAHERVYRPLVERVRELALALRQGDPSHEHVDLGAMICRSQIELAERLVQDAIGKGARLVCGGRRRPGPGQFFEPTVLAECDHSMDVMREEVFGPVVPMMSVRSDDEAVTLANDSPMGLSAYVFTRRGERARRLADRIEAGSVVVNDVLSNYASIEAPFGGVKQSGFGRVHGADSLREMCHRKHLSFDRVRPPARDPFWFPYSERTFRWLRKGAGLLFARGNVAQRIGALF